MRKVNYEKQYLASWTTCFLVQRPSSSSVREKWQTEQGGACGLQEEKIPVPGNILDAWLPTSQNHHGDQQVGNWMTLVTTHIPL